MVGYAITDDKVVQEAAKQEIIRRYFKTYNEYKMGRVNKDTALRVEVLMNNMGAKPGDRKVSVVANLRASEVKGPVVALELPNGKILTGRGKETVNASAAVIMNSIKELAGIDDSVKLLSPISIDTIQKLKKDTLGLGITKLNVQEALIALAFSAASTPVAGKALAKLNELRGCEAHSTVMLTENEIQMFNRIGVNITCESEFEI